MRDAAAAKLRSVAPGVRDDLMDVDAQLRADAQAAQGELLGPLAFDDAEVAQAWLQRARQGLHDRRHAVLTRAAQGFASQMQLDAALPCVARLLADNPLDEAAARWLMQLHFRKADGNAALRVYAELVRRLQQQDQTTPDAQTRDLARLTESSSVRSPNQAPPAAGWTALLRPPQLVERETEWLRLQQAWAAGAAVIVTGEAGMGKSRLLDADPGFRRQARAG